MEAFTKKSIKKIASHYGLPIQKVKTVEELGELIVVLQKDILGSVFSSLNDKFLSDEILEEIADVTIMLEQLIMLSGSSQRLENEIERKISRQLNRINEEQTK